MSSAVVTTWLHLDVFGCLGEGHGSTGGRTTQRAPAEIVGRAPQRLAAADVRLARSADIVVAVNDDAVNVGATAGSDAPLPPERVRPRVVQRDDCAVPSERRGDDRWPASSATSTRERISRCSRRWPRPVSLLVLIGPKDPTFEPERFVRLAGLSNVTYLGPTPFDALPPYLAAMDVGLVPYGVSEFNRWSFPMKTLEYLAAGLPVVSTSLPAIRWLDTPLISLADTPTEFAAAVGR